MKSPYGNWLDLTLDGWRLAAESQAVIALRLARMAVGDAGAAAEAQRMVTEKLVAAAELPALFLVDALAGTSQRTPQRTLAHYRRKVRANRRRLSRG